MLKVFQKGDLVRPRVALDQEKYIGIIIQAVPEEPPSPEVRLTVRWIKHPHKLLEGGQEWTYSQYLVPARLDEKASQG